MTEKEYISVYKAFKPVFCKAFQEIVYFNADGLNHLCYKNFRPRPREEVIQKLALLPYVHEVILKSNYVIKRKKLRQSAAATWALECHILKTDGKRRRVRVVFIKKRPNAKLYFLSVMEYEN